MKRRLVLFVALVMACVIMAGCQKEESTLTDYGTISNKKVTVEGEIPGHWGEKVATQQGSVYPFEFDQPLTCNGFTLIHSLEWEQEGYNKEHQFKVFVRNMEGEWVGVTLFDRTAGQAQVEVDFGKERTFDAVFVRCQASGVKYTHSFAVTNPVY